jgi:hypothetical protein
MKPLTNEKFILADSFLYGNLLKTSSETYTFRFQILEDFTSEYFDGEAYCSDRDNENCFRKKGEEDIFLKPSDIISNRGTRRIFYVKHNVIRKDYVKDCLRLGK